MYSSVGSLHETRRGRIVVFSQRLIRLRRKCTCLARQRRVRLWRKNSKLMAFVYILFSNATQKFYVGSTDRTVPARLGEHNAGKVRSTKSGKPWKLVASETHETYTDARKRESFLKSGVGRKWIYEKFHSLKEGGVA
jgi:putative endonuclease